MEITSIIKIISISLTSYYLVIVFSFIRGWHRIKYDTAGVTEKKESTHVTVIIAARNEEKGIARTLDDLVRQRYPKALLEIIFVDDHSTDRTSEIIKSYRQYGIKLITLNEDKPLNSYKKKAIQTAIGQSAGQFDYNN